MSAHRQYTIVRKAITSSNITSSPELQRDQPEDGNDADQGQDGGVYWKAYTTMISSFLCGMLLALGHHLFYRNLDGKPVGAPQYIIRGVTRQQLNLTLGTLFAFLVKAFLVVAVIIAYTQIVWGAVKKRSTRLNNINTIFSGPATIWSLLRFSVWRKYPLLLILVLAIWLIPIASIITPAALTVTISAAIPAPSSMIRVPNVDFLSLNFANIPFTEGFFGLSYGGPRNAVIKVVTATAAQGAILPISPPAANSSWILEFTGPAINCTDIQGSILDDIKDNIETAMVLDGCATGYGYIGWTPSYYANRSAPFDGIYPKVLTLPFILSQDNKSYIFQDKFLGPMPLSIGVNTTLGPVPATFYAATFPSMTNYGGDLNPPNCLSSPNPQVPKVSVVQCVLYNTSYQASFSFKNGEQIINITKAETPYNPVMPYDSIEDNGNFNIFNNDFENGTAIPNSWNTALLQTLSYQAVMESLGQLLVGTVYNSGVTNGVVSNVTSVLSTVLGETEELAWLDNFPFTGVTNNIPATFRQLSDQSPGKYWNGVDSVDNTQPTASFKEVLETLFQNITIGLMSSKLLQPNPLSPYAPPLTNVTLPKYQTVYVYAPFKLWLAYGLAILFAAIAVLIGLVAMFSSGMTYSNEFSTIFRTARYAQIDTDILPEDAKGDDPLPHYLGQLRVSFSDGQTILKKRRLSTVDKKAPSVTSGLLSTVSNNPS